MKYLLLIVLYKFIIIDSIDIFTSLIHLKEIVENEEYLFDTIKDYVISEEEKLQSLERLIEKTKGNSIRKSLLVNQTADEFLSHPLNAYYMIKKYALDWQMIVKETNNDSEFNVDMPDETDITGAASGIIRLQRTYQLSTDDLAMGNVKGRKTHPLTSDDCSRLADSAKAISEHGLAVQWLNKSLDKYNDGSNRKKIEDLVRQMVDILLLIGNTQKVTEVYENVASQVTDPALREYFEAESKDYKELNEEINQADNKTVKDEYSWIKDEPEWKVKYEEMCRGDFKIDTAYSKYLRCRFVQSSHTPFERFKQEILSFSPFISLYHDIISDKEAEMLKEKAVPSLHRAQVGEPSKPELTNQRVGKVGWIFDNLDGLEVTKLSARVARATSLSTSFREFLADAEPFQVVNYGIGGQYEPHTDFYQTRSSLNNVPDFIQNTGDRIATWMFYISKIEAGGGTVFPEVGVAVPPIKNAAAFWYNFEKGSKMDLRTKHAGCPVLLGQKWVANKWIREYGQFFNRPCPLNEEIGDEDSFLLNLGYTKNDLNKINNLFERPEIETEN